MNNKCHECRYEYNVQHEVKCPSCGNEPTQDEETNILDWIDKVF
jgi:rRNA maturation endonuclease Nob1